MVSHSKFLSLMAIGDAFGMKYEFVEHTTPIGRQDLRYGPHPKFTEYKIGHYTDDTQMSLANAELLLSHKTPQNIKNEDFVQQWLNAFKRDPRYGYSRYMFKVLTEVDTVSEFVNSIDARNGVTSGAAMRAGPFGLVSNRRVVEKLADAQAAITHNTPAGRISARAVALAVHFLHHSGRKDFLPDFLEECLGTDWHSERNGYSDDPNNGLKIVGQALDSIQNATRFSQVLLNGVNQADISDTDTLCALAMLFASRCRDISDDLPSELHDEIENGAYGVSYLGDLDCQLTTHFPDKGLYWDYFPLPKKPPAPQPEI